MKTEIYVILTIK